MKEATIIYGEALATTKTKRPRRKLKGEEREQFIACFMAKYPFITKIKVKGLKNGLTARERITSKTGYAARSASAHTRSMLFMSS